MICQHTQHYAHSHRQCTIVGLTIYSAQLFFFVYHVITVIQDSLLQMFLTGLDMQRIWEKPARPPSLHNVLTFLWRMEYHLMTSCCMMAYSNECILFFPCSYLTYTHSLTITHRCWLVWFLKQAWQSLNRHCHAHCQRSCIPDGGRHPSVACNRQQRQEPKIGLFYW